MVEPVQDEPPAPSIRTVQDYDETILNSYIVKAFGLCKQLLKVNPE
jgi:hypothetical protein